MEVVYKMLFTEMEIQEILDGVQVLEKVSGPIDYYLSESDRFINSGRKETIAFICEYATEILKTQGIRNFNQEELIDIINTKLTVKLQSLVAEYIAAGLHSFTQWKIFQ